jgi:DNA-binding Lrp family transcriptional regulator
MAKTSKKQIEKDEKLIIQELQKNAKESIDIIAKNCGFSRQKVWRIIKRLEKNKTIWGYTAIIDDEKIGVKRYIILIKRNNEPLPKDRIDLIVNRSIRSEMEQMGITTDCSYFLHGPFDWALSITAKSIVEVKRFTEGFSRSFKDYISDIQIMDVIIPLEQSGIDNPHSEDIRGYF